MREKILNILCVVLAFFLGVGCMYIVDYYIIDDDKKLEPETVKTINENRNVTIVDNGISEAVNKVYDSVVMVKNFEGNVYQSSGSGFVYKVDDKYGYILTNHHVIDKASKITIVFSNEKEVGGTVLGSDQYLDVAVVRVDKNAVIKVADIGASTDLKLGDTIFAVGSPVGGEYYNTITRGIVSGLDRKITVSVLSNNDWVMKAIQVDAAINPGNSGGPLVNSNGEIVGINSMKLVEDSVEGMGFSIKIEDAMAYVNLFEQNKKIERPLLGITLVNATEKGTLSHYGIKIDNKIDYGVVVITVLENSGASKSALKQGDVIIKIGKEKVNNQAYLKYILYSYKVGDVIEVTYLRNNIEYKTQVTLTKDTTNTK